MCGAMDDRQPTLFNTDPDPWDEDDRELARVARIVFPGPPHGPLEYLVPGPLAGEVEAGQRVMVPLGRGNRRLTGYCVEVRTDERPTRRLKSVLSVVDERALIGPRLLDLARWMADYYLCPLGQVLESIVPSGVRRRAGTRWKKHVSIAPQYLTESDLPRLSPQQRAVLDVLRSAADAMPVDRVAERAGCTQAPVQSLLRRGVLVAESRRVSVFDQELRTAPALQRHDLNPEQRRAADAILEALRASRHETFVLRGVTGSGKTEVYLQVIEEVVAFGRQAIVLVPEISLTPQTWERFQSRFGQVAVLHSQLTAQERNWHWQRIAEGRVSVVVGARSAIFAPVPHLGLIVIDEEHDNSFKQDTAPRYHARTVGHWRAAHEQVPMVLGSATPSLETWAAAEAGRCRKLELVSRVAGRMLPDVKVVDLRGQSRRAGAGVLSRPLVTAMREALADGGQIMLLLNRRGFDTHIQCPQCGLALECPECDVALTHHRHAERLQCHFCNHRQPVPTVCPECGSTRIRYSGLGTEKLEAHLGRLFPDARLLRMDGDTMKGRDAHEAAFQKFRAGQADILLGTQMIAKGHDFPGVTLVGVVNADTGLHLPDFRAGERTFQLVTQVAGRTGRGDQGGRVIVQTSTPEHAAIRCAVRHDYESFARQELAVRKRHLYPPFGRMIRLLVRGREEDRVKLFAESLAESLRQRTASEGEAFRVIGSAPAPYPRLHGKYRYHVLLLGTSRATLRAVVAELQQSAPAPDEVTWVVDVDPVDLL